MSRLPSKFWSGLPLGSGVELLTHDANGLAALAKPAGVLSHPNMHSEQARSLLVAPYTLEGEFYEWTSDVPGAAPQRLYLLNRLDSATSGVILVATSEALAKSVREMFLHKHVRKIYNALVFGQPSQPVQVWRDRLTVKKKGGQVRASTGGNIPAEAEMTVLRQRRQAVPPLALVRLDPRTGRSHQLRVQCSLRHLPIVGDATYGDFGANREFAKATGEKRLFLHSLETRFDYQWAGRTYGFSATAPLPKEFHQFL
ncbi:MAG TPA: RNA pseudouridine synthase [Rariglobus sp.]|jgi:23S rRNA-/tRNA-specific pseudouridylate synthase|nr:RNA pseudouridine synthase [Rariglobus sp.]